MFERDDPGFMCSLFLIASYIRFCWFRVKSDLSTLTDIDIARVRKMN